MAKKKETKKSAPKLKVDGKETGGLKDTGERGMMKIEAIDGKKVKPKKESMYEVDFTQVSSAIHLKNILKDMSPEIRITQEAYGNSKVQELYKKVGE